MTKEGYQPIKEIKKDGKIIPPNTGSHVHMKKEGYTWEDLDKSYWEGFDSAKNKMEKRIAELEKENAELEKENAELEKVNNKLTRKCDCLTKCNDGLQDLLDNNIDVLEKLIQLQEENFRLKTVQIPQLERKIASIRGAHSVDCKKLNARIEQVERLKKENAELRSTVEFQQSSNMNRYFKLKKAKEVLENLLPFEFVIDPYALTSDIEENKRIFHEPFQKAEQFLKEIEE